MLHVRPSSTCVHTYPITYRRCGNLLDSRLTAAAVTAIFTRVNAISMETGGDDDAQELDEGEFIEVINQSTDCINR